MGLILMLCSPAIRRLKILARSGVSHRARLKSDHFGGADFSEALR
jgi:hypothetical protein